MSEVMVRNSTRNEIENSYHDYDLEHRGWAIEKLFLIIDKDSDAKSTLNQQVSDLENDVDTMEDKLNVMDEENEELRGVIEGLKERLSDK